MPTISPEFGTLRSRGYHMTEQDIQDKQDKALGKFMRQKQILAAAETEWQETCRKIKKTGEELQLKSPEQLQGFQFSTQDWLNVEALQRRANDMIKAKQELDQAKIEATNLGVSIPFEFGK